MVRKQTVKKTKSVSKVKTNGTAGINQSLNTQTDTKEIHFYLRLSNLQVKEFASVKKNTVGELLLSYGDTKDAINNKQSVIHTLSLANLQIDLFKEGYKIFIHNDLRFKDKAHREMYEILPDSYRRVTIPHRVVDDLIYETVTSFKKRTAVKEKKTTRRRKTNEKGKKTTKH